MRVILFLAIISILFIPTLAFSQATPPSENVTLTTYYPAPYGEYKEVSAFKLRLGGAPAPQNDGNVTFLPQTGNPDTKTGAFANGETGEVAYSSTKNAFYYYDGSKWAGLGGGGGGGCYVSYSGTCITGFTNKGSAGTWGYCAPPNSHQTFRFRPAGGTTGGGWDCGDFGTAVVCCQ